MAKRLLIVLKRPGQRKADGSPYLQIKALVRVGERSQSVGMDVIEQYVDPGLDAALSALPGLYEYDSESRPMNGRLEEVITAVRLVKEGVVA